MVLLFALRTFEVHRSPSLPIQVLTAQLNSPGNGVFISFFQQSISVAFARSGFLLYLSSG